MADELGGKHRLRDDDDPFDDPGPATSPSLMVEQGFASVTGAVSDAMADVPGVARRAARRESRLWLPLALVVAVLVSFGTTTIFAAKVYRQENELRDTQSQLDAFRAAQQVAQQRAETNLATIRVKLIDLNNKLTSQGKPVVPLPDRPEEASSALALANVMLQVRKEAVTPGQPGKDGLQGPEGPRGPAGPTCPAGTSLRPVVFADGTRGKGCVNSTQSGVQPSALISPGAGLYPRSLMSPRAGLYPRALMPR